MLALVTSSLALTARSAQASGGARLCTHTRASAPWMNLEVLDEPLLTESTSLPPPVSAAAKNSLVGKVVPTHSVTGTDTDARPAWQYENSHYPYMTLITDREFVYGHDNAALSKALHCMLQLPGGEGGCTALSDADYPYMSRMTTAAFIYGQQEALGKTLGNTLTATSIGGGAAGSLSSYSFPYLTRKTEAEFVYGPHESLGKAIGCVR